MKMIDTKRQEFMENCANYVIYLFLKAVNDDKVLSPFLMEEFLGISEVIDSGDREILPAIKPVVEEEMREGTYLSKGKDTYLDNLSNFFERYYLEKGPFYRMIVEVVQNT